MAGLVRFGRDGQAVLQAERTLKIVLDVNGSVSELFLDLEADVALFL